MTRYAIDPLNQKAAAVVLDALRRIQVEPFQAAMVSPTRGALTNRST
jgi:hypothetical protein